MNLNSVDLLLAEDNDNDAELIIRELKKNNFFNSIFHVKDGEDALDFIFATGKYEAERNILFPPGLVLLDIQMPKVNGIEVLQKIKADSRTKKTPVVMLTSSKETPDMQKCYYYGVNSYIVKPVKGFADAIKNLGFYWLLMNQPPA